MSPTPNPRINTGWRANTLAEKPGHRHRDSDYMAGLAHDQVRWPKPPAPAWKPSDGYIPTRRDGWTFAQLFCAVVALGAAAVVIALEVAQWIK